MITVRIQPTEITTFTITVAELELIQRTYNEKNQLIYSFVIKFLATQYNLSLSTAQMIYNSVIEEYSA